MAFPPAGGDIGDGGGGVPPVEELFGYNVCVVYSNYPATDAALTQPLKVVEYAQDPTDFIFRPLDLMRSWQLTQASSTTWVLKDNVAQAQWECVTESLVGVLDCASGMWTSNGEVEYRLEAVQCAEAPENDCEARVLTLSNFEDELAYDDVEILNGEWKEQPSFFNRQKWYTRTTAGVSMVMYRQGTSGWAVYRQELPLAIASGPLVASCSTNGLTNCNTWTYPAYDPSGTATRRAAFIDVEISGFAKDCLDITDLDIDVSGEFDLRGMWCTEAIGEEVYWLESGVLQPKLYLYSEPSKTRSVVVSRSDDEYNDLFKLGYCKSKSVDKCNKWYPYTSTTPSLVTGSFVSWAALFCANVRTNALNSTLSAGETVMLVSLISVGGFALLAVIALFLCRLKRSKESQRDMAAVGDATPKSREDMNHEDSMGQLEEQEHEKENASRRKRKSGKLHTAHVTNGASTDLAVEIGSSDAL